MNQFEREEDAIMEQINNGELTQKEGQRQLNELYRDYRGAAEEAAQHAYDDEMSRW